ncbi:MAG: SUF system NifU family Fe-S cluster assembly protein [Ignavibacteriales bacterium]|nr:SUF system NifU family Fe-S cluster assembly protein [Ignavibacteriales bacterium]
MMSDLRSLYQEIILDHNKNPRNYRAMEDADRSLEGYNPLCGDHYTIYLKLDGGVIADISFTGSGCAISKASASVMSTVLKGKTREEAERFFVLFHDLVMGQRDPAKNLEELGKMAAFGGVSEFPARVKCASLAWHTLKGALEEKTIAVTTE